MPRPKTSSLGLVIPKPAARPVSPFVGPGPLQRSAVEDAAAALTAFAPRLQDYQGAVTEQNRRDLEAEASAEFSPVVSKLIGKSPEEQEKAYAEAVSKGLIQQQGKAAEKARDTMWGAGDAQWVWSQFSLRAANEEFNSHTDPLTNELVEGKDPTEALNELKAQALKSYGASQGGANWSKAFNAAMGSYQREIDYQILKLRAADDHQETIKSAKQNFSVLVDEMGLLVIPKKDDQDKERINQIQAAVQEEYRQVRDSGSKTWARDVSEVLIGSLNVFRARGSDEETLDVLEEIKKTQIGNKTLGQIEQFQEMTASLEMDLRAGAESEQDKEDRRDRQATEKASRESQGKLSLYRDQLKREGLGNDAINERLRARAYDLIREEEEKEDGGDAGIVSIGLDGMLERWKEDMVEEPGVRAMWMARLRSSQSEEELDRVKGLIDMQAGIGAISDSYGALIEEYENLGQPVVALNSNRTWSKMVEARDKAIEEEFKYLGVDDAMALRKGIADSFEEYQERAFSLVENGRVDHQEMYKLKNEWDQELLRKKADSTATKQDVVTRMGELVRMAATPQQIRKELSGRVSGPVVNEAIDAANTRRAEVHRIIKSEPSAQWLEAHELFEFKATEGEETISAPQMKRALREFTEQRQRRLNALELPEGDAALRESMQASDDAAAAAFLKRWGIDLIDPSEGEGFKEIGEAEANRLNAIRYGERVASGEYDLTYSNFPDAAVRYGDAIGSPGTAIPDTYKDTLSRVYSVSHFRGRTETMGFARASLRRDVLREAEEKGLSDEAFSRLGASVLFPGGISLDSWISGKEVIKDTLPRDRTTIPSPFGAGGVSVYEPLAKEREFKFRPSQFHPQGTPILDLVQASANALDANKDVLAAQLKWWSANESKLKALASKLKITEGRYEGWKDHHLRLAAKQAQYE